jgi:flavin reductase (DIM6/NTAB) family NADH-FMN oxidoreductase RutF
MLMMKIDIGGYICPFPLPVSIFGANVKGKPNFMAISWFTRVNGKPPLFAAGINKGHYSNAGIRESGAFSINIPSVDKVKITDYCGIYSGKEVDKSALFDVFYGELKTAPMISQCPVCIECRLKDVVDLPTHNLFIGEAVAAYTEHRFLTEGRPDIVKMRPFVLSLGEDSYWSIGEQVGKAWSDGKEFNPRE